MLEKQHIVSWLERSAALFEEKKAYLTELDAPIGDSDHGINMARGFKRVLEKLPTFSDTDIGNILKSSGTNLLSSVGGASGPLYGTFFMRAGMAVQSKHTLEADDVVKLLSSGMEGIVQRGRTEMGDKTILDALSPGVDALRAALAAGETLEAALTACAAAAEQGVQNTIPLVARKGRASYLGERSVGHQDPGATSTYFLLKTLAEVANTD